MLRVATWNVNSLKARLERVEQWIEQWSPDVLCLQETKLADDAFPAMTFAAEGYEAVHHGPGRWNGVAILSRVGIDDVCAGFGPNGDDPDGRIVFASCGGLRVASVYVPNGREVGHEQYEHKLTFLGRLAASVGAQRERAPGGRLLLCGDFNVAPDDRDVWDPAAFVGATHVSDAERAALAEVESAGVEDLFRLVHDAPGLFTWWDYRAGNFHKKKGMRIDLMLGSGPVASGLRAILVDRNARKGKGPSDHAPMVADVDVGGQD